jgi:hypothetical protein
MVRIRCWWLAGTSAALLSLNTAQAQSVPHDLIVRVYNTAAIPRGEVIAAQRVADNIFRRARIGLRWRECRTASGPSAAADDPCADPLQPGEVMARLAEIGRAELSESVLGYALVTGDTQVGALATVFADRVSAAAVRLHIERTTLLGRTLAHELGHLLLGSNSHGRRGVMRAWWADNDLRRRKGTDWQFSGGEARHMTVALLRIGAGTSTRGARAQAAPRREPRT